LGYIPVAESLGISSTTFRQCAMKAEFGEIMQNKGHYTIQGHRFWYQYDFLLVTNTNLPPLLHRFRDIAVDRSKIAILDYPSCV